MSLIEHPENEAKQSRGRKFQNDVIMPTRGEGEGANRAQAIQILAFAHILAFGSQAYRSFS